MKLHMQKAFVKAIKCVSVDTDLIENFVKPAMGIR